MKSKVSASDILRDAAETFDQRNTLYGDNYKKVGAIWKILYPDGLKLHSEQDFIVYHLLDWAIGKITRAAAGGAWPITHVDSIHDATVYMAMVQMVLENASVQGANNERKE